MTQTAVPVSTLDGPDVGSSDFFSLNGAGTVHDCLDALGDTAFVSDSSVITHPDLGGVFFVVGLDPITDPGVDTGHKLIFRLKYITAVFDFQIVITIRLLTDPIGTPTQIRLIQGQVFELVASGELGAAGQQTNFVTIEIPLTEPEVQLFRANGGYSNSGLEFLYQAANTIAAGPSISSFDASYFALEIPGTAPSPPLEVIGSGGFIFSGQGLGLDYFVPEGGFEFGGEAILGLDPLILTGSGGLIFGGSAGLGGNQLVGTGGFIFSGGGRDFLIRSPDIGGIYFLDPTANHDTFYLRDGFQGTEDVKIPDPFIQTAFLGD